MSSQHPDNWYGLEDLPDPDPELYGAAKARIMASHFLVALRENGGQSLQDIADRRGVTKAAVHQLENRPFDKIQVGNLLSYLRAVGYDVDAEWAATTLAAGLPEPTLS